MMPELPSGWYVLALALSLCGFALLALASDREGEVLLGRPATARQRHAFRLLGWVLLALALWLCIQAWLPAFGTVMWFGWLTVAAIGLVLTITYWPWRPQKTPRRPRVQSPQAKRGAHGVSEVGADSKATVRSPQAGRAIIAAALIIIPVLFIVKLWQAPALGIHRDDAVHGQIGPWSYVLAEANLRPPKTTPNGAFIKAFDLRLSCPDAVTEVDCQSQIRGAYLKVRKPRNVRGAGNVFVGPAWRREVEISIPPGAKREDQIWLTVERTDGEAYFAAFDIADLSPATARFIKEKQ